MKTKSKTIIKYFIEFLIVAFGVFLGVFVSEWRVQKKVDDNTHKTLSFLLDEMDLNIIMLEKAIDYHTEISNGVDSMYNEMENIDLSETYYSNKKFRYNELPNWHGLGFASMESIVFESAKINNVFQELNISTTRLIANIYKHQEGYNSMKQNTQSKLSDINSSTKVIDVLAIFERVKYDVLSSEKWLLIKLKESKSKLKTTTYDYKYRQ